MTKMVLLALAMAFTISAAQAAVLITVTETAAGVTVTAAGSLSLVGLPDPGAVPSDNSIAQGRPGFLGTGMNTDVSGAQNDYVQVFSGFSGPLNFGTGTTTFYSNAQTGFRFAVSLGGDGSAYVIVPLDYSPGNEILSESTILHQTIGSLGLTPGEYQVTSENDRITIDIGSPTPVPEPISLALLGAGVGGIAAVRRRRVAL